MEISLIGAFRNLRSRRVGDPENRLFPVGAPWIHMGPKEGFLGQLFPSFRDTGRTADRTLSVRLEDQTARRAIPPLRLEFRKCP